MSDRDQEPVVIFKKRERKPSEAVRRRVVDDNEAGDDDKVDTSKIADLKLLKALRSKDVGVDFSGDHVVNAAKDSGAKASSGPSSSFKQQFSSHTDHGIGVSVPHEKIMQKFIDDKMGVGIQEKPDLSASRGNKPKYTMPAELIVETTSSSQVSQRLRITEEEGAATSWSTGIAEVALPQSFRAKNEQETAAAVRVKEREDALRRLNRGSDDFQRFTLFEEGQNSLMPSSHSEPVEEDSAGTKRKLLRSTDDLVMKKYKEAHFAHGRR